MARGEVYNKLIHSRQWRALRLCKLLQHPCCERCARAERTTPATEVHHITPVDSGATPPEKRRLMFDPRNLVSLCRGCHTAIHKELGSASKEQVRERTRSTVEGFVSRYLDPDR